jgi:aquaporin Z
MTETRKLLAEAMGTACLVFFAVGTATLCFGFKVTGTSIAAGVVATALAFGFVLLVLVYAIGGLSGCHINPAVTIGFLVARRINIRDAIGYWIAQFIGAIFGAFVLWIVVKQASTHTSKTGLGADGYGAHSIVGLNLGGTFLLEVILTMLFVFVVLTATRKVASANVAGVAIGLGLVTVHLIGIPLDGTSVNPARALGPAIFAGNGALGQVWVFIVAPLIGGILAALVSAYFFPEHLDKVEPASGEPAPRLTEPSV